jgi:hypothetical protein
MMSLEQSVERELAWETEVLGEKLHHCHFLSIKNPTWPGPGSNLGRRGGKSAINLVKL